MNILITGGAGFIGSHLARRLLKENHQVTLLDNLATGNKENLKGLEKARFVEGSIQNKSILEPLIKEAEIVYHLAAAVGVKLIMQEPLEAMETNIGGTKQVLSLASKYNTKVVIASSSEVYGKCKDAPLKEDADRVLGPTTAIRWNYAVAKATDEYLALAYHSKHKLPIVICRFFNTIGPGQVGDYGMVIPTFVKQALANKPITIYGDGLQSRCFGDVEDVVTALTEITTHDQAVGEVINIGNNEEITIKGLAEKIIELTGSSSKIVYETYEDAYGKNYEDIVRRVPDITKMKTLLGITPTVSLQESLKRIIDAMR